MFTRIRARVKVLFLPTLPTPLSNRLTFRSLKGVGCGVGGVGYPTPRSLAGKQTTLPATANHLVGKCSRGWSNLLQGLERWLSDCLSVGNRPSVRLSNDGLRAADNRQKIVVLDCKRPYFARFRGLSYTSYTLSYTP